MDYKSIVEGLTAGQGRVRDIFSSSESILAHTGICLSHLAFICKFALRLLYMFLVSIYLLD